MCDDIDEYTFRRQCEADGIHENKVRSEAYAAGEDFGRADARAQLRPLLERCLADLQADIVDSADHDQLLADLRAELERKG